MAGDWMPIRIDLADDPAVIQIASTCNIEQDAVVGKLVRLWAWANTHTTDGHAHGVSQRWVDDFVRRRGFAGAMAATGWIEFDGSGCRFPKFDHWNSASAKTRLQKSRRQSDWRASKPSTPTSTGPSTQTSTREEKSIEEINTTPKTKAREPPSAFAAPDWVPAVEWADFDEMRKRKSGKGWTLRARELAIEELAKLVQQGDDAGAVLRQSVLRTWAGLFPVERPRAAGNGKSLAERRTATLDAITGRGNGRDIEGTAERMDRAPVRALQKPLREQDGDDVGDGGPC